MIRGKITIFNILMRMSPGKAMTIMTSAGSGDAYRSRIPATEPMITPKIETEKHNEHWTFKTLYFTISSNKSSFISYIHLQYKLKWENAKVTCQELWARVSDSSWFCHRSLHTWTLQVVEKGPDDSHAFWFPLASAFCWHWWIKEVEHTVKYVNINYLIKEH